MSVCVRYSWKSSVTLQDCLPLMTEAPLLYFGVACFPEEYVGHLKGDHVEIEFR